MKKIVITVLAVVAVLAIAVIFAFHRTDPPSEINENEIALQIQLDLKEDVGLLIIDSDIDGQKESGGISNADKTMLKKDDLIYWSIDKQHYETVSDMVELLLNFTVITEYCDPNYENIYPEEYTMPMKPITFTAKAGDVMFVNSGVLHSGIPQDCIYQCIVFDMNTFLKNNPVCGEYIQKILHQETMLFPHFSDEHPQILNCISVLFDAMYEKDTGYELTVFGQFYHFFGLIFSNHYFIENPTRTRRDYKRILQLKQVLEFIEKNYANPITLQELSASVSMSPKYFCRFFSEMTHQTPVDYLNRQRIEEACLQLAATDDSITEIAYRNGFNDLSYFIRTFKKYKGMTPGKYKRR